MGGLDNKWALEEHFSTGENNKYWNSAAESARNGKALTEYVESSLLDVDERLRLMDKTGIERSIVSLTSPGIQSITDIATAIRLARETNDLVRAQYMDKHPHRLSMFACIATQDPGEAAAELDRAVRDLGAVGVLVNGYTNVGDAQTARYLDHPTFAPLWAKIAELRVPLYLHPREPLPSQTLIYDGYPALVGSAWGFGHETATHAVRLMLSGIFDQYPGIQVILGHLGEGLPFLLPGLEHRLDKQREGVGLGNARRTVSQYFSDNFYVTTSGHFHTRALFNAIANWVWTASCSPPTTPTKPWKKPAPGSTPLCSATTTRSRSAGRMLDGFSRPRSDSLQSLCRMCC